MLNRHHTPHGLIPPFLQACAVTDGAHKGFIGVSEVRGPHPHRKGQLLGCPHISLELKIWNELELFTHGRLHQGVNQRLTSYFTVAFPTYYTGLDFPDTGLDGPKLLTLLE